MNFAAASCRWGLRKRKLGLSSVYPCYSSAQKVNALSYWSSIRYREFSLLSQARQRNEDIKEITIDGEIDKIVYSSAENGYTVGKLKVAGNPHSSNGRKLKDICFTGKFPPLGKGMHVSLRGVWGNHATYGVQFKVSHCSLENSLRTGNEKGTKLSGESLEVFLSSGLIKGVGKATAKRIVAEFGDETLSILNDRENGPKRLSKLKRFGLKSAEKVVNSWQSVKNIQNLAMFLQSVGLPAFHAKKLDKLYGDNVIDKIKENPYKVIQFIPGIGFIRIDAIALRMGLPIDSEVRLKSLALHVLSLQSSKGHCFLHGNEFLDSIYRMGQLRRSNTLEKRIKDVLHVMITSERTLHMRDSDKFYLPEIYWAELGFASRITEMMLLHEPTVEEDVIDQSDAKRLSEEQIEAVRLILSSPVSVLTGGPGTGKTFCLHTVVQLWKKMGKKVLLASPTARAAKRLEASTKSEACTIHRLLEYAPLDFSFRQEDTLIDPSAKTFFEKEGKFFNRNGLNKLEMDCLVIDESSMLDISLAHALLDAVPDDANVVFVGDSDQLPSVGPGEVFKDLIESGVVPRARLNKVFRQAQGSEIVQNAHLVNKGMRPTALNAPINSLKTRPLFRSNNDSQTLDRVLWLPARTAEEGRKRILTDAMSIIKSFGLDPGKDMQVLSPMNAGQVGVKELNIILQDNLNPRRNETLKAFAGNLDFIKTAHGELRLNDRVIQQVNDYEKDVYNGDLGRVVSISEYMPEYRMPGITVEFAEENSFHKEVKKKVVNFSVQEITDNLNLGYACTVHKSQGSEYQAIILPLFMSQHLMLKRNILYTALTRAKKLAILIGEEQAICRATQVSSVDTRFTSLQGLLRSPQSGDSTADASKNWTKKHCSDDNNTHLHDLWEMFDLEPLYIEKLNQ